MRKLLLVALFVLSFVTTASAQLPKVTLKSIDVKTVSTDTLSNNNPLDRKSGSAGMPTSLPHGVSLATANFQP